MDSLKPCPFCGGEAQAVNYGPWLRDHFMWYARCSECGVSTVNKPNEADAIAAWNTRAERTCHVEHMPKNKELRMAPWIECSECGGELPVLITANYCRNCGAKVVS